MPIYISHSIVKFSFQWVKTLWSAIECAVATAPRYIQSLLYICILGIHAYVYICIVIKAGEVMWWYLTATVSLGRLIAFLVLVQPTTTTSTVLRITLTLCVRRALYDHHLFMPREMIPDSPTVSIAHDGGLNIGQLWPRPCGDIWNKNDFYFCKDLELI